MNIFPEHLSYYSLLLFLIVAFLVYRYIRKNPVKIIVNAIIGFVLFVIFVAILELVRRAGNIY